MRGSPCLLSLAGCSAPGCERPPPAPGCSGLQRLKIGLRPTGERADRRHTLAQVAERHCSESALEPDRLQANVFMNSSRGRGFREAACLRAGCRSSWRAGSRCRACPPRRGVSGCRALWRSWQHCSHTARRNSSARTRPSVFCPVLRGCVARRLAPDRRMRDVRDRAGRAHAGAATCWSASLRCLADRPRCVGRDLCTALFKPWYCAPSCGSRPLTCCWSVSR